jgi:hypothetical protein
MATVQIRFLAESANNIYCVLSTWVADERLGRLVGSCAPRFFNVIESDEYRMLLIKSQNKGFRETYLFHRHLSEEEVKFAAMFNALKNPNASRGTGITHSKFLCLISALRNENAPPAQKDILLINNSKVLETPTTELYPAPRGLFSCWRNRMHLRFRSTVGNSVGPWRGDSERGIATCRTLLLD